jgi:hypothetical protein
MVSIHGRNVSVLTSPSAARRRASPSLVGAFDQLIGIAGRGDVGDVSARSRA